MPDNIRITTPVSSSDSLNRVSPSKHTDALGAVDTSKIQQAGAQKQELGDNFKFLLNRNSVFSKFIEQLNQTPGLSQNMEKIMLDIFGKTEMLMADGGSPLLKQLAQAMQMDPDTMLENLRFQSSGQTKFSDGIFKVFRELSAQNADTATRTKLAEFLSAYDGFFSIGDTTKSIIDQLEQLKMQIPNPYRDQLDSLAKELTLERPTDNLQKNLTVLKNKIIPFLAKYINASNDFGRARDTITLLVHNLARLNTSSQEELDDKFNSLMDYLRYERNIPAAKTEEIKAQFLEHLNQKAGPESTQENALFRSLTQVLSEGSKQNTSSLSQALYKETILSMLMDKSVYMPFHHLFLPVNYNGQFMFSEVWIEKKEPSKDGTRSAAAESSPTKIYLTFDIRELGYFEASIELLANHANVAISCPPELASDTQKISDGITEIFTRNGLVADRVYIRPDNTPTISQLIMKKINERKYAIDVTI